MTTNLSGYNFAYLDEQTKRMIRRAILKAVAIPGYQVPFGGREMPMPYVPSRANSIRSSAVMKKFAVLFRYCSGVLKITRC